MTMTLAELIEGAAVEPAADRPMAAMPITGVVEDSRLAHPGCLFIARPGTRHDGRRYIDDSIERGAVAVLSDGGALVPKGVASVVAGDVALAAAVLAERFYSHPSRALRLVGVTGTNGKTTTAHLVHQLLSNAASSHRLTVSPSQKCGLIGTVAVDDGVTRRAAELTTPAAIDISRTLRSMVDAGCTCCAMEVSSHALHQKRVAALEFGVAIFTNLSGDHLDYHGTMEEYAAAKAMLFERVAACGAAIVNADDPQWRAMAARCPARIIRCSMDDPAAECFADVREENLRGLYADFRGPWGSFESHLPLIGSHNAMNALQAIAACSLLGLDAGRLERALAPCEAPPGRLEPVTDRDDPFAVFVDYAHTDDALENVLGALRPLVPRGGKLRVVFGCGGDRDRTKRPRMAAAAWCHSDEVIITSDNPRTEDPDAIIGEVCAGVPAARRGMTECITDRRAAIREAVFRARADDIVLIAGKGHEDYQIIGAQRRPFDDRIVAAEALAETGARSARRSRATGT